MIDTRKKVAFSLDPTILNALKDAAKKDGRNTSRYLEAILAHFLGLQNPAPIPEPKKP